MSGTILMGDVSDLKACIDARKSKEGSLRDDPKVKDLMGRLPNGLVVEVDTATPVSSESYADLVAYGKSYTKVKKDTLKLTAVYLFVDEPAASAAQQAVVDHLSATFEGVKVKRDGNLCHCHVPDIHQQVRREPGVLAGPGETGRHMPPARGQVVAV